MTDFNKDLASLNLTELKELLKEAKTYRGLSKQLWSRWVQAYKRSRLGIPKLIVDHFTNVPVDMAWEQASRVYKSLFDMDVKKDDVEFRPKQSLKWWIKVYMDDKMVDLSYAKIEKQII